jgi:hypothetical protein
MLTVSLSGLTTHTGREARFRTIQVCPIDLPAAAVAG